jgi:ABC-type multidrug transport system fused ATPase/permease subunit
MISLLNKKKFILVFMIQTIFSFSVYGVSYAFQYYLKAPLTVKKVTSLIIVIGVLYVINMISQWGYIYFAEVIFTENQYNVKKRCLEKIYHMKVEQINNVHTGFIHSLVAQLASSYNAIIEDVFLCYIPLVIGVVSFLICAMQQSPISGVICMILFVLAVYIRYIMVKKRQPIQRDFYRKDAIFSSKVIDFIQNISTVKKFETINFCKNKLNEKALESLEDLKKKEIMYANNLTVFNILIYSAYFIVLFNSLLIIRKGQDGLVYIVFYTTIMNNVKNSLLLLVKAIENMANFMNVKNQLADVIGEEDNMEAIDDTWSEIRIKKLLFRYKNNQNVVSIDDFLLTKGDKVCITGKSGQGKTTFLNLISGYYPYKCDFYVDSVKTTPKKLNAVYISQEIEMFNLSIRENLCLGQNIEESKILNLFKEADLTNWYNNLSNGLDTILGEKGINISTGQKQRLNIIRGILCEKDVYFFDEPSSNLDEISEIKMCEMINKYLKDKTIIIITHREKLKDICNKHFEFINSSLRPICE